MTDFRKVMSKALSPQFDGQLDSAMAVLERAVAERTAELAAKHRESVRGLDASIHRHATARVAEALKIERAAHEVAAEQHASTKVKAERERCLAIVRTQKGFCPLERAADRIESGAKP